MEDEVFQENQETEMENTEFPSLNQDDVSNVEGDSPTNPIPQINEDLPTAEDTTIADENTSEEQFINIDGQNISLDEALYREHIKTNFYLSLLLIVTVVFFIINKFWAFCRRLFKTQI